MTRRKKYGPKWWQVWRIVGDKLRDPDGRTQLLLYAGAVLFGFAIFGIADRTLVVPDDITDHEHRFGWNETIAKAEAPVIAASMPKFAITDADGKVLSGEGKSAELWKFAKLVNGGKHIATWRQESGDCVSMGWSNAIAYRQAYQIAKEQRNEILKIPFPPYAYGTSRVLIGKRQLGRGAGSVGAWAAQASLSWGVLPTDKANELGFHYSGRLADNWGWNGPPKATTEYGSKFRIRTVAQVRSWDDLRDALVHGFPVTIASNVGFNGGSYDRDGKRWLRAAGSWPHQMCVIGVEDRPDRLKGAYIINSWGTDAHPRPLNDEPLGGFWADAKTIQRIVSQGDSWAYSDFDGFPATDDVGGDWTAFKAEAQADPQEAELVARVEQPDPKPVLLETRKMFSLPFLYCVMVLAVVMFVYGIYRKYGNGKYVGLMGAILIGACLIGVADRAQAGHRRRLQMRQTYAASACNCPTGVCALGQCAANGCANGQCATANCANGKCSTGYVRPAGKPRNPNAGLSPELQGTEVAAEKLPADIFNAFEQPDIGLQAWTSFAPADRSLRTYEDCYEHEKDFVLVVGSESDALMELEASSKPVAWEASHKQIAAGKYRVFDAGGLKIEPLAKPDANLVSKIAVRKQL